MPKGKHRWTKYRPKWCQHPPFESIGYCWGLGLAVERGILAKFFMNKCDTCEFSKHFKEKKLKEPMEKNDAK